jgi:predicted metal-dependent phosphoesterase TrpH
MKIDLHIHSKDCSDGRMGIKQIFEEAEKRDLQLISITDHDSIDCQQYAVDTAAKIGMSYIPGVEINVTFSHHSYNNGKSISLDLLGYRFDVNNQALRNKLYEMARYREKRAQKILGKINIELDREGIERLTEDDLEAIQESVDGVFGRPHIAAYLIRKGIVETTQEAFDRYLVKCDVPKYPLLMNEASKLIREAGGVVILAHPNDPRGTSLVKFTTAVDEQTAIIEDSILPYIDGVECWHSRHDAATRDHYEAFAKRHKLVSTGGSDCHQDPILLGTVEVPGYVADQFNFPSR